MNRHRNPGPLMVKTRGFRFPRIACALIILASTTATHASLIPTVFVDTPTQLFIQWDWDEFDAAGIQIADLNVPALVNWEVVLTTNPFGAIPVTWDVVAMVSHITDPHPGDIGGGNLAILQSVFQDNQFLGLPVLPFPTAIVDHPGIGHVDEYEMQVFHSLTGITNSIKLFGTHIPGPATLCLLALGSLTARRRRR